MYHDLNLTESNSKYIEIDYLKVQTLYKHGQMNPDLAQILFENHLWTIQTSY